MNFPILLIALVCNMQGDCDYFAVDNFQTMEECKHDEPLFDFTDLKSRSFDVRSTECVDEENGDGYDTIEDQ